MIFTERCAWLSPPTIDQRSGSVLSSGPSSMQRASTSPAGAQGTNHGAPRSTSSVANCQSSANTSASCGTDRAAQAEVQVARRRSRRRPAAAAPVAPVDVHAAGEADRAVDHQDLAVVAQVHGVQPRRHERRVEHADRHAGALQRLRRRGAREARVEVVDQHAHRHAAVLRALQRLDELAPMPSAWKM